MNAWVLGGWTMLHFLWIGTLVAAAGAVVRLAVRRGGPNLRYGVSLATLAAVAALPVGIAAWLAVSDAPGVFVAATDAPPAAASASLGETRPRGPVSPKPVDAADVGPRVIELKGAFKPPRDSEGNASPEVFALPPVVVDGTVGNPSPSPSLPGRGITAPLARLVGYLPYAWLVGAPITFLLLAAGLVGSGRLRRAGRAIVEGPAAEACARLRAGLRISRRVALAVVDGLAQPVLVGIVRPTILLPAAALSGWTVEELEMVLLHELAHVRRWDNAVNLAQRIIESLLFFHPCVWLASRQVRRDREDCCDAIVVQHTARPDAYASLLVSVAAGRRHRQSHALAIASAMADHPLAGRIRRILKLEDEAMWISRRMLGLLVAIALLSTAAVYQAAFAQPEPMVGQRAKPRAAGELTGGMRAEIAETIRPNEIAAAVLVSPVTGDAVMQRVRELNSLGHNVRIYNGQGFHALFVEVEHGDVARGEGASSTNVDELETKLAAAREGLQRKLEEMKAKLQATDAGDFKDVRRPKLMADIQLYQSQLIQLDSDLADIEVMKQVAIMQAESPSALASALKEEMSKDPTIAMYKEQLFTTNQQIQAILAGNDNPDDGKLLRLKKQVAQTEQMFNEYREKAEAEARERLAKVPNEALKAAMIEYDVRSKYLTEKKTELEKRLRDAQQEIEEGSIADPELVMLQQDIDMQRELVMALNRQLLRRTHGVDFGATGSARGQAPMADTVVVPADAADEPGGVYYPDFEGTTALPSGDATADELVLLLKGAERGDASAIEALRANDFDLKPLFDVSEANSTHWVTYSAEKLPHDYDGLWEDFFDGLRKDPYGPQYAFEWTTKDNGKTFRIGAPRKAHAYFRWLFSGQGLDVLVGIPSASGFGTSVLPSGDPFEDDDVAIAERSASESKNAIVPTDSQRLPEVQEAYDQGVAAMRAGKMIEALAQFAVAIRLDASFAEAHLYKGHVLRTRMEYVDAVDAFSQALDINPKLAAAYHGRGECYLAMTPPDYNLALGDLTKAVDLDPRNEEARAARDRLRARGATGGSSSTGSSSYRLGPGDSLSVRAIGVIPDSPIDGAFIVEEEGTLALGPWYGRVEVAGLTVREAEAAVQKQLTETLKDMIKDTPRVQVTLLEKAPREKGEDVASGGNGDDAHEYGASFPQDMGGAEAAWIVQALQARGIAATAVRDRGTFALRIVTAAPLPSFKVVWESHMVGDRVQRMCRFIGPDGADLLPSPFGQPAIVAPPLTGGPVAGSTEAIVVFPPNTSSANANLILRELQNQGYRVALDESGDGLRLQFSLLSARPRAVWETRIEDGRPRSVVRLIGPDGKDLAPMPAHPTYLAPEIFVPSSEGNAGGGPAASSAERDAPARLERSTLLYDGKTFDQWRNQWRQELKVPKRIEAIEALAAFARAGQGREAAEALLDVAGEYDFTSYESTTHEGKLKKRVRDLLTVTGFGPKEPPIAVGDWLPSLVERLKKDPAKWGSLMRTLLPSVSEVDEPTRAVIRELMDEPKYGVSTAAFQAYLHTAGDAEESRRLLHEGFKSESAHIRLAAVGTTGFTDLESYPEAFEFLIAEDAETALKAREVLLQTPETFKEKLAERLWAVIEDPAQVKVHVEALRALGALRLTPNGMMGGYGGGGMFASPEEWAVKLVERLEEHLRTGPREELAAAAWARFHTSWATAREAFRLWEADGKVSAERLKALLELAPALVKENEAAVASWQPDRDRF